MTEVAAKRKGFTDSADHQSISRLVLVVPKVRAARMTVGIHAVYRPNMLFPVPCQLRADCVAKVFFHNGPFSAADAIFG
jgi:hypothetical protein